MAWGFRVATSQSQNPGANQSTVYATAYVTWNSGMAWAGSATTGSITIDGVTQSLSGPSEMNYNSSTGGAASTSGEGVAFSWSRTFTHDANGFRGTKAVSAVFDDNGFWATPPRMTADGTTQPSIDYVLLPSAPSSVTASAVGSVITVTCGEASTPGPTITAYKVSYASSTNGGASWSAWSTEVNMTNRVYTYSSLTPGLTYKFQVRATNGDGDGPYTESNTVFLTAGGKRYTGSNWALTAAAAKRFNGSAFVSLTTAKRYTDAGTWVSLS